jgi:protein-L-isoaspartate(D-aspartate) O-methyltransferase
MLAEIVGTTGRVTAIEIDPDLATKARRNLADYWPQATVVAADGFTYRPDASADAIVVNAGLTHLSLAWLDALAPENGRLLVPVTSANWTGGFLLITRNAGETRRYPARYVMWTGIIPCAGGCDATAEAKLKAALARSGYDRIRSLRRAPDEPDETCWLASDGWWLSTAEAQPRRHETGADMSLVPKAGWVHEATTREQIERRRGSPLAAHR